MRVFQTLFLLTAFAATACDDATTDPTLAGTDGATLEEDGTFEPDAGPPRHPWYVDEGPGGPVVQIPIAFPGIGGLFVHTREMSNAEARALGADIPTDAIGNLPVLVDWPTAAAIANAASMRDGLEPCYHMPIGPVPALRPCDGWRLATPAEWQALVDDAMPTPEEWAGVMMSDRCAEALDVRNVCYGCTCDGQMVSVGGSVPNRFGLYDMIGNAPELVSSGNAIGGGPDTHWSRIRNGVALRDASPVPGGIRFVSLPPL